MPQIPGQMQLPIPGQPTQLGQQLARVGRGLWANRADVTEPVENAWDWGTFWSRVALWFLVIATILIPLVALTGQPAIIAPMGLVPLAGLLAVFLRPHGVSPLWGGVIAYWPERIGGDGTVEKPKKGIRLGGNELRLDARRVSGVLFAEALLAEYYALIEYAAGGADVTLVFVSFVLFVTAGLGVGSQPGRLRNIGLPLVAVAIVGVSIVFALGGKSGIEAKAKAIGNDDAKAAPAEVAPRVLSSVHVELLGFDRKVGPVLNMNDLKPPARHVRLYGAGNAEICFQDRVCGGIYTDFGERKGPVWLRGPAGESVTIEVTT